MAIYQIFIKHLDGRTQCLQFATPTLTLQTLRSTLSLPTNLRLIAGTLELTPETLIFASLPSNLFPSLTLLPRLRGGKGGFGSLLRGAATKAGQKKTNNFDACRDMSGRRLRHVNAERKLEEWRAGEDERKLAKLGEEFLKKKEKERRKEKGKDGEVEKYLQRFREDSERCMEAVEESVRQSFGLYQDGKRKVLPGISGSASKRMKIWLGKKKVGRSDEDNDEDEDGKVKAMVLNDGNCSIHDKEDVGTSVACLISANSDGETSGKLSEQSNLEEVCGVSANEHSSAGASDNSNLGEVNEKCDSESPPMGQGSCSGDSNSESDILVEGEMVTTNEVAAAQNISVSMLQEGPEMKEVKPAAESPVNIEIVNIEIVNKEVVVLASDSSISEEPFNFDKYNSAEELEVLGIERLKTELQSRGMKCGGTLKERAARLFLLKTTPLEKLPKKVLASKAGGK